MNDYLAELRSQAAKAEKYFARKLAFSLGPVELKYLAEKEDIVLIDVREKEDYDAGHLPKAISIPKTQLTNHLGELSRNNLHVVYCYNEQCQLAARAALILARNGFMVMELNGGYDVWCNQFKFEIEK